MSDPTIEGGLALHCPGCRMGYLLPRHLLGEGGARITCPACAQVFTITRDGAVTDAEPAPALEPATPPEPVRAFTPRAGVDAAELAIAAEVLDAFEQAAAGAPRDAAAQGRLFAAHGPALLQAYERYRERVGSQSDPAAFREEMRARYGVDLFPAAEARR